jgi:hypothetical protein
MFTAGRLDMFIEACAISPADITTLFPASRDIRATRPCSSIRLYPVLPVAIYDLMPWGVGVASDMGSPGLGVLVYNLLYICWFGLWEIPGVV